MKANKGITMVALVVTIIVLIILAGISINMLVGDNGIITLAQKAKENTELAKIEEEKGLNSIYEELKNSNSIDFSGEASSQLEELQNKYNELQEKYNQLQEEKNQLQEEKDNLQTANNQLQEEKNNLQTNNNQLQTEYNNFKTQVASAITNKGVATNGTDANETIISHIAQITGGRIETMTVRIGNANTTNSIPAQPGWTFVGAYITGIEVRNSNGHMTFCNFGFSYNGTSATGGAGSGAGDGANTYTNAGDMYAIYARVVS